MTPSLLSLGLSDSDLDSLIVGFLLTRCGPLIDWTGLKKSHNGDRDEPSYYYSTGNYLIVKRNILNVRRMCLLTYQYTNVNLDQ